MPTLTEDVYKRQALAGVKKSVIIRAKEIAGILESREQKTVNTADIKTGTKKEKKTPFKDEQIDFFAQADNPVITQLKELEDVYKRQTSESTSSLR